MPLAQFIDRLLAEAAEQQAAWGVKTQASLWRESAHLGTPQSELMSLGRDYERMRIDDPETVRPGNFFSRLPAFAERMATRAQQHRDRLAAEAPLPRPIIPAHALLEQGLAPTSVLDRPQLPASTPTPEEYMLGITAEQARAGGGLGDTVSALQPEYTGPAWQPAPPGEALPPPAMAPSPLPVDALTLQQGAFAGLRSEQTQALLTNQLYQVQRQQALGRPTSVSTEGMQRIPLTLGEAGSLQGPIRPGVFDPITIEEKTRPAGEFLTGALVLGAEDQGLPGIGPANIHHPVALRHNKSAAQLTQERGFVPGLTEAGSEVPYVPDILNPINLVPLPVIDPLVAHVLGRVAVGLVGNRVARPVLERLMAKLASKLADPATDAATRAAGERFVAEGADILSDVTRQADTALPGAGAADIARQADEFPFQRAPLPDEVPSGRVVPPEELPLTRRPEVIERLGKEVVERRRRILEPTVPQPPKRTTASVVAEEARRTAPEGTLFHGTGLKFSAFREEHLDTTALFGPGIYLTDDAEIAASYARARARRLKIPEGNVELVQVPPGARLLDLEQALPEEAIVALERQAAQANASTFRDPDAWIAAAEAARSGSKGTDVYRRFQEELEFLETTRIEAGGELDTFNLLMREAGFDGMTHTGGIQGGRPHNVTILYNPDDARIVTAPATEALPGAGAADVAPSRPRAAEPPAQAPPARAIAAAEWRSGAPGVYEGWRAGAVGHTGTPESRATFVASTEDLARTYLNPRAGPGRGEGGAFLQRVRVRSNKPFVWDDNGKRLLAEWFYDDSERRGIGRAVPGTREEKIADLTEYFRTSDSAASFSEVPENVRLIRQHGFDAIVQPGAEGNVIMGLEPGNIEFPGVGERLLPERAPALPRPPQMGETPPPARSVPGQGVGPRTLDEAVGDIARTSEPVVKPMGGGGGPAVTRLRPEVEEALQTVEDVGIDADMYRFAQAESAKVAPEVGRWRRVYNSVRGLTEPALSRNPDVTISHLAASRYGNAQGTLINSRAAAIEVAVEDAVRPRLADIEAIGRQVQRPGDARTGTIYRYCVALPR